MRLNNEIKKLWINKINSILNGGLDLWPPIQEMILEISKDNKQLALLIKYSDISSKRTNQLLYILKEKEGKWIHEESLHYDNISILSMSMNDSGNKIALSILNEGLIFSIYNEVTNKWDIVNNYLEPLYIKKEDLFGHEVVYDAEDNLLVSAPFKKVNGSCNGIIFVFNSNNIIINTIESNYDTPCSYNFFGISISRNYLKSESTFKNYNEWGVNIGSVLVNS